MSYAVHGRQYVGVAAGANIMSFAVGPDPSSIFGEGK
jgi:hypothetical protein